MSVALCCISHSPLIGRNDPAPDVRAAVDEAVAAARAAIGTYDPELVVLFAPDHLNGFLYRLMPQFCVGINARAIGDFGTAAGSLAVDGALALRCAEAVLRAGVDVAVSLDMTVDHGFAQPLTTLLGGLDARSVVPIFVNAAGAPRAPMARSRALGAAVGRWAAGLGQRVLVLGSGGLSHDPPTPSLAGAGPELMDRLVSGISPEARAAREATVAEVAREHAAGGGSLLALAPDFDREFMELLSAGRLEAVDEWEDSWLSANFGRAVHEIRSWVAAFSALDAAGPYEVGAHFYAPIPEWIVGFGLMTAFPVGAGR